MGLIAHVSFTAMAGHPASYATHVQVDLLPEINGFNSPCKYYSRGWSP